MPTSFIVLIAAFACFASVADCKTPPRGEEIYQNRLEEDAWKRLVEQRMKRQVAGEKPPWGDKSTWKDYWTSWYRQIRISPALPWKGSQFKNDDDMIAYIKRRLKAHGLPTYE
jgi:hypothetical protein